MGSTDWVIKAETVTKDSFKIGAFSEDSKKELLGSLGFPWRRSARLACGGGRACVPPPGQSSHHVFSPPVQRRIENGPATQSAAWEPVFDSVEKWLDSLPKTLYPRAEQEAEASSPFSWDCLDFKAPGREWDSRTLPGLPLLTP